ncbi:MAG: ferrochelatase [Pseudomonadota bacterium]
MSHSQATVLIDPEIETAAEPFARPVDPKLPADHPPVQKPKIGVLLLNLGTPDGTDYRSMRRYLGEFLSDPRVIEVPKAIWQPILQGIILTFRPSKSGEAYKEIWRQDTDESPLRYFTRGQAEKLQAAFGGNDSPILVDWAMRYGTPAIRDRVDAMVEAGCNRILLAALYPQYSATTTATAYDQAFRKLTKLRWQPAIRTLPAYHDHPAYIEALAQSIEAAIAGSHWTPERLLLSFHGLPKSYFAKGDPYHCHCAKTARLLRERLPHLGERIMLTFQSRFGPQEWLQPYTDKTVEELAAEGVKRLMIATPGFSVDCVETLEEIDIGVRETFFEGGGEHFAHIPCLNDSDVGMALIQTLVEEELQGWIDVSSMTIGAGKRDRYA